MEFESQYENNIAWEKISPIFFRDFRFRLSPRSPNTIIVTFEIQHVIEHKRPSVLKAIDRLFGVDFSSLEEMRWMEEYSFYFNAVDGKIKVSIDDTKHASIFVEELYPLIKTHDIDLVLIQGDNIDVIEWDDFKKTIRGV